MAYAGYLIKLGGSSGTPLPMKFIGLESYTSTPNQRLESKAARAVTGILHRTTCSHTATKIEFETPYINNKELAELNTLISGYYTSGIERKISIQYYDQEWDTYNTVTCYMPDIKYVIDHIDPDTQLIIYKPIRYAFIEY